LREIQKNDCLTFDEDIIGKDKFFFREHFVKNSRETNMIMFEYALDKPKKLMNKIQDMENEECKI
jgi:hypothetical protein